MNASLGVGVQTASGVAVPLADFKRTLLVFKLYIFTFFSI